MKNKPTFTQRNDCQISFIGLHVNISRVFEIASVGSHSITFAYFSDKEDKERSVNPVDIALLCEYYGINPVKNGDLIAEITRPNWDMVKSAMTRNYETLADIQERITTAKKFKRPDFNTVSEGSMALLGTAYDRLNFCLKDVELIKDISRTIAQMAYSDTIKVEHIAEAIQYRALLDEPQVKIYEN